MEEYKGSAALDAGLISAAQAVDTMRLLVMAHWLHGRKNLATTKAPSFSRRRSTRKRTQTRALSELAESVVNQEAQQAAAE